MLKALKSSTTYVVFISAFLLSCNNEQVKPSLRASLDYSLITAETPYSQLFVDNQGVNTVDLKEGNVYYKMFLAINYYSTSSVSANTKIEAAKLRNMFSNTGNPFADVSTTTISISGQELNTSNLQLKSLVASSKSDAALVRTKIESYFTEIELASNSINSPASAGVAGKLGTYLVDKKGLETAQLIQKSLIGALQLDYISNILLVEGLNADNQTLVSEKPYTQLEHNWDVAYGMLTLNPVFLKGSTDASRATNEFAAGSYIWEFNKASYAKIHPAFLKGRAAIVNNDRTELTAQALFIRTEFEKTMALASIGYLEKWKTGTTDAARAHSIAEGLGFIYSLRFTTMYNADAQFSDGILNGLIGSANGFWDLDAAKINAASDAIKAKFKL